MKNLTRDQQIAALQQDWADNPRWKGIQRGYSAADVVRLRGSFPIEYTPVSYTHLTLPTIYSV